MDARTATAADFDAAAQRHANSFWFWLIVSAVVFYFVGGWWTVLPALLVVWSATSSVSSSIQARHLRRGTYKIPNPNNGAPDGDARNLPISMQPHAISKQNLPKGAPKNPGKIHWITREEALRLGIDEGMCRGCPECMNDE